MAAEHGELVAEHQDLQVFGGVTAGERRECLDRTAQREIGEFRQHRKRASDSRADEGSRCRAAPACEPQLRSRLGFRPKRARRRR